MSESRFTAATKYDADKPPMDLIPWEAMQGVAQVLDFGRLKYSPHNWRKGFIWSRLAGAALRHLFAWLSGEEQDAESKLSHIDHAICCLMFLSAHIKSGLGKDDRAHKLLAEPQIPAAHVPKGVPARGYRWWCNWWSNWSTDLSAIYVSREVANQALETFLTGKGAAMKREDYDLREVDRA